VCVFKVIYYYGTKALSYVSETVQDAVVRISGYSLQYRQY